jgi:uncharacterized protein (TIGR03083 family)
MHPGDMNDASANTWIVAESSGAGLTAQLTEVWDAMAGLGRSLSEEEWTLPTACPGWPVAAQYAHVIGTESALLQRANPPINPGTPAYVHNDIGRFNERWVAALAPLSRTDVLEQFAEVTASRKEELAEMSEADFDRESWTPIGQADYRRFMQIRVFDCWIHEQDVRDATGRPGHEEGPAPEQSVDEIVRAIGYLVGKKAAAPAGSTVTLTLTGPIRRTVHVASIDGRAKPVAGLQGEPTAAITLTSTAFTRLACGRVEPAAVLGGELGGVEMTGDADLGQRLVSNLAFTI